MDRGGVRHVHAHFANHPAVAALIVHRLTGIPFSFTAHGSDLHVDRTMLDRKIGAARFAVTVAEFNRRLMLAECGPGVLDRIHVIHCGVDPMVFSPPQSRAQRPRFTIVCVARFEEVKGHRLLVQACRLLHERGLTFVCHLVGDGPLRRQIERHIAELGLRDHVLVHGACARPEVARRLSESSRKTSSSTQCCSRCRSRAPQRGHRAFRRFPYHSRSSRNFPVYAHHGHTKDGLSWKKRSSRRLCLSASRVALSTE